MGEAIGWALSIVWGLVALGLIVYWATELWGPARRR